jgi:NADH-quinone oxidoreductase subunit M
MLAGVLYLYGQAGSFSIEAIRQLTLSATEQAWLFAAFTLAFAIKVPVCPLHTWLPVAHVEAPTAGSVVLAGVMLKMGTYGLIRFSTRSFRWRWNASRRCSRSWR